MSYHSIVLADPLPAHRAALRRILESDSRLKIVAEARTGHEALDKVDVLRPSAALIDVRLPGLTGFHVAAALRRLRPNVCVILLHGQVDDDSRVRALRAGATGLLSKHGDPNAILASIQTILSERPLAADVVLSSPRLMLRLVDELRHGEASLEADPLASLTMRETEVLDCLMLGYPNREIGDALFLAEQTVKNYMSALLRKLGTQNRTAALRLAFAKGWAEIGSPPRVESVVHFGGPMLATGA